MRTVGLLVALVVVCPVAEAAQGGTGNAAVAPDAVAQAYEQFLLAHRLEAEDDIDGAAAAYRRAMELDPQASDLPAELAALFLRAERMKEAIAAAEQALAISPDNLEAHRVLGTIYASMTTGGAARGRAAQQADLTRAIGHLEKAVARPASSRVQADANLRAMLARLYILAEKHDQAIPLLVELVRQEPGWQDGPPLLVQAYVGAGRGDEAITWLEESAPDDPQLYATLADFYSQNGRWRDAATAYERALSAFPRSVDMRVRYASLLLGSEELSDVLKARDALREATTIRPGEETALYLLSQAERRAGDPDAAERAARRLIAQNGRNARGFTALAEALEETRRYKEIVDALAPAAAEFRAGVDAPARLLPLLPHLGFAYQQIGQLDRAIATFDEARKLAPRDPDLTTYLIQAHLAAKNFTTAAEIARAARTDRPDDLRLLRLEAEALSQSGKANEGIALIQNVVRTRGDDPIAHIALAQVYSSAKRGAEAVKVLQDAQSRFPSDLTVTFELGAALEREQRFAEAESAFRQLLSLEPDHSSTLNYLGYMLAERGERLSESVDLIQRALELDPNNGAYLDSLGWAYFKDGKLDLALENMQRAADQLVTNSVVQDHYGDVLFSLGRYEDAVEAWTRALAGDGDSVEPAAIEKKIRNARQKLPRR
jgi:tetratricopeptide (TPR) repeat protein